MAIKARTTKDGTIGIIEIRSSLIGDEEIDELREAITDFIEQGNKKLILDLSRVSIINSAGIGALISAYTNFSKSGGDVVLTGVNKSVKNVFIITKLSEIFDIQAKLEDAVNKFSLSITN